MAEVTNEAARRNLARKYPEGLAEFETQLSEIRILVDSDHGFCPDGLVEKDCPIYRAAHACHADVILTGDVRDFGILMHAPEKTEGLLIQTVADFLDSL